MIAVLAAHRARSFRRAGGSGVSSPWIIDVKNGRTLSSRRCIQPWLQISHTRALVLSASFSARSIITRSMRLIAGTPVVLALGEETTQPVRPRVASRFRSVGRRRCTSERARGRWSRARRAPTRPRRWLAIAVPARAGSDGAREETGRQPPGSVTASRAAELGRDRAVSRMNTGNHARGTAREAPAYAGRVRPRLRSGP